MKTFWDWFRCAVDETTKFAKLLNKKASNLRLLLRRYRIDDQGPSREVHGSLPCPLRKSDHRGSE
jgi:hypothetical protein